MKILVACGTRPEIVKLAPVTHALVRHGHSVRVVFTGQHTDPRLADDFLADLGLVPDEVWDLPSRRGRARAARSSRRRTRSSPRIRLTRCCSSATRTPSRCSRSRRDGSACRWCTSKPGCARSTLARWRSRTAGPRPRWRRCTSPPPISPPVSSTPRASTRAGSSSSATPSPTPSRAGVHRRSPSTSAPECCSPRTGPPTSTPTTAWPRLRGPSSGSRPRSGR